MAINKKKLVLGIVLIVIGFILLPVVLWGENFWLAGAITRYIDSGTLIMNSSEFIFVLLLSVVSFLVFLMIIVGVISVISIRKRHYYDT